MEARWKCRRSQTGWNSRDRELSSERRPLLIHQRTSSHQNRCTWYGRSRHGRIFCWIDRLAVGHIEYRQVDRSNDDIVHSGVDRMFQ